MTQARRNAIQNTMQTIPPTWLCLRLLTEAVHVLDTASDVVYSRLLDTDENAEEEAAERKN